MLGSALEYYDFVIFVYFTAVFAQLFFPADTPAWLAQLQAYAIFAAGYLARFLGGVLMAHFGDKQGRKKIFSLSIFLMAVPTLGIGLLPTYAQMGLAAPLLLLAFRVMQGAAIGGEVPGAWIFVAEHASPKHIGLSTSLLSSGIFLGIFLGAQVALWLNTHLTADDLLSYGWRVAFILGGLFGLLAVFLRRYLSETPVFEVMKAQRSLQRALPLRVIVSTHRLAMLRNLLLGWVFTAAIIVVILMTPPSLLPQYGITPSAGLAANSWAIIAAAVGCAFFGYLSDRMGAGRALIIGALGLLLSSWWFYTGLPHDLLLHYSVLGFFVGLTGCFPSLLMTAFPAAIRFSGLSTSYNLAYALFGSMTPLLIQWTAHYLGTDAAYAYAYYVGVLAVLGVVLGGFAWTHRTAPAMHDPRI
jgi:MFS family permease